MGSQQLEIVFSIAKNERVSPENGLKVLTKRLRQKWSIETSKDIFREGFLSRCRYVIFASPQRKFSTAEFNLLKSFLDAGGSMFFWLGEDSEEPIRTNINYLLEEYGMALGMESVIRGVFQKYFIPKEALISDGYLQKMSASQSTDTKNQQSFLFPYGTTLKVKSPAVPLLTTGSACFPMHQPICAFASVPKGGKVMVLSSGLTFTDNYIDKENNLLLLDRLFSLLTAEKLPRFLPDESDLPEAEPVLDIGENSRSVFPVLEATENSSMKLSSVFDTLFELSDLTRVIEVLQAYGKLSVPNQPLTLIAPKFEGTLPLLQPAVYAPVFEDVSSPQLEFFNFEKEFAAEKEKINQIYTEARRTPEDLPTYISTLANALSIGPASNPPANTHKEIIEFIAARVIGFKRSGWIS
ncbi:intraflagellar transport protein 52 homolog [Paramacrobiotus metropolitanus]|uniref:intraflagellar transport protein 52 homolog n=1 Tax=Paramacrobiotus metropolitanus TaxID=2943436 RepID=UPI0024465796|nr:intraflagellar transport protein 52 homolog [Paramacrobiotus metropolitanus]XP_055345883.1 intraflagellar transport protein 52 homolog [Paramacrobiotus metropolitanus]